VSKHFAPNPGRFAPHLVILSQTARTLQKPARRCASSNLSFIDTEPAARFISILQQTPDWVWGLLAALTFIGLKQTLPRRRSLRASISLPLVMVFLSLYGVASAFPSQPLALIAWASGGAVTLLLAQILRVWGEIRWLPQERSVLMPGLAARTVRGQVRCRRGAVDDPWPCRRRRFRRLYRPRLRRV
jgi:hypothetical protein